MKKVTQWAVLALAGMAVGTQAEIISTFDTDAQGWMIADNANPADESSTGLPIFHGGAGNPGGFISLPMDWTLPGFFVAPDVYLGDQSSMAGGTMSLDRIVAEPRVAVDPYQIDYSIDITMTGVGSSVILGADLNTVDVDLWKTQSVAFDETGGWVHLDTGIAATNAEIAAVLASLDDIRVRGNLNDFGGAIGIDNFQFTPVPTPGSILLLGVGGVLCTVRRRRH